MTKPRKDLTGSVFGRWKVISQGEDYYSPNKIRKYPRTQWLCEDINKELPNKLMTHSKLNAHAISFENSIDKATKFDISGEYGVGYTANDQTKFIFDLNDYDKIKEFNWTHTSKGGIVSWCKGKYGKTVNLHSLITDFQYPNIAHINGDKNDYRKSNLAPKANKQTRNKKTINKES